MKNITKAIALLLVLSAATLCSCQSEPSDDELESGFSYETQANETKKDGEASGYAPGEAFEANGFAFTVKADGTAEVTAYKGTSPAASIPGEVNGVRVTSIASQAFYSNGSLATVNIPDSVTAIGDDAFSKCANLTEVTGANGVCDVGSYAFNETALLNNATDEFFIIGNGILLDYNGSDTEVTVPDGVRVIASAFSQNADLISVILPEGVVSLCDNAFSQCSSLRYVTMPESLTLIGDRTFSMCTALEEIILPEAVTSIGDNAFLNCLSITEIDIPFSVVSIGESAFFGCGSLSYVYVPYTVENIGEMAFNRCASDLEIHCVTGSPADIYCSENGLTAIY